MSKVKDKKSDNIIQLDYAEEMRNSYRDYAMSVIVSRALPDVRDGLKPVQRRILYSMHELGLDPKKPHRKSARIVGDTIGKYHPHGDISIYDSLVHMTEDYALSLPLVDGHGNFGSIDGDSAAAMRYTEARLSEAGATILKSIDDDLVEFLPNFDNSEHEPSVLPATLPNLLINGTTGIAVGMSTNIPPHNPNEVIDGVIAYMDNSDINIEGLMKHIPAPDFPTGGTIINKEDLLDIYSTGSGKIRLRGKVDIEKGEYGRTNIVVTEIPYTIAGNKTRLVENLSTLLKEKVFDELHEVRDESSKEGIRVVIEVKKDRDVENLLNGLYKKTPLEDTYGVNLLAIKDQQPVVFNLKSLIEEFVSFQEKIYTREFENLLKKASNRLEIVGGLIKATDVIDLIIEILRGSNSTKQAKDCLINGVTTDIKFKTQKSEKMASKLDFTERQADAILAMPLGRLIGLEILKLHDELTSLDSSIAEYTKVLGSKKELYKVIKKRLLEYKKTFNKARSTLIKDKETESYVEEIIEETIYVFIDRFGYTKTIDSASYSRTSQETLNEYSHIIAMKNTDKLCIFTDKGNMHQVKVFDIPEAKIRDKGVLIQNLSNMEKENIVLFIPFEDLFESQLVFMTQGGYIKQVSGAEFETVRATLLSTKLEDDDKLVSITPLSAAEVLSNNMKIIIITKNSLSLGFDLNEISELKRMSRGVRAIKLDKDDCVDFSTVVENSADTFTYNEKELSAKKVRKRKRAQKGHKANLSL